jgi:hypothetical protein
MDIKYKIKFSFINLSFVLAYFIYYLDFLILTVKREQLIKFYFQKYYLIQYKQFFLLNIDKIIF